MKKKNKINKFLFWMPRTLAMVLILFSILMSLDVFQVGMSPKQIITGFLIHNIPTLILFLVLLISWKYELVGGITFIATGILYILMVSGIGDCQTIIKTSLPISGISFIIGVAFLANWVKKEK